MYVFMYGGFPQIFRHALLHDPLYVLVNCCSRIAVLTMKPTITIYLIYVTRLGVHGVWMSLAILWYMYYIWLYIDIYIIIYCTFCSERSHFGLARDLNCKKHLDPRFTKQETCHGKIHRWPWVGVSAKTMSDIVRLFS